MLKCDPFSGEVLTHSILFLKKRKAAKKTKQFNYNNNNNNNYYYYNYNNNNNKEKNERKYINQYKNLIKVIVGDYFLNTFSP